MKEKDIYRDTYLRYLGYANEVGEAFRPLVPNVAVKASYAIAIGYVCADAYDKATKVNQRGGSVQKVAITAGDVLIWQMLASVIIPGFTINRITKLSTYLLRNAKVRKEIMKTAPTAVGLAAIPLIITPIDHFVDYLMENTFRKWLN